MRKINYKRMIYKKKYSLSGILLFLLIFSIDISYKLLKYTSKMIIKFIKWFIRYIQFVKSGYSYQEIYNIIMQMDAFQFEHFCYELLKALGMRCKPTPKSNDYGRDIIIYDNEGQVFVECKHYTGENSIVGREICQKLLGSMQMFGAYHGIIINTGKYHNNAYECVNMVDNLELWDMSDIMRIVAKIDQKQIPRILTKSLGDDIKVIKLCPINE